MSKNKIIFYFLTSCNELKIDLYFYSLFFEKEVEKMLQMSFGDNYYAISIGFLRNGVYILDIHTGYIHMIGDCLKREITDCKKLVIDPNIDVLQQYKHLLKSSSGFDIFLTHISSESLAIVNYLANNYKCQLITEFNNSSYPLKFQRYSDSRNVLLINFASRKPPDVFVGDLFDDLLVADEFDHAYFALDRIKNIGDENRTIIRQLFKNYLTPRSRIYPANYASININPQTYEELLKII